MAATAQPSLFTGVLRENTQVWVISPTMLAEHPHFGASVDGNPDCARTVGNSAMDAGLIGEMNDVLRHCHRSCLVRRRMEEFSGSEVARSQRKFTSLRAKNIAHQVGVL